MHLTEKIKVWRRCGLSEDEIQRMVNTEIELSGRVEDAVSELDRASREEFARRAAILAAARFVAASNVGAQPKPTQGPITQPKTRPVGAAAIVTLMPEPFCRPMKALGIYGGMTQPLEADL